MHYIVLKYLMTAGVVVLVSEVAKRSDRLGGLLAALPLVTILSLIWLYAERQPAIKIANHAYYTFWYVLPTLPMFLIFPSLFSKYGFWTAIAISGLFTLILFAIYAMILKEFDINLL